MTKEPIMNCEYCIVLGNENKCKALQTETHTCLGITAKNKCPIYKLKMQSKRKEEELNQLKVELKAEKNKLFLPTCYEQLYKEAKEMNNDITKKYFDLKKENKELKTECEEWKNKYHKSTAKMTIKEIDQSTYIKQLEKTINRIRTERDNYKQALTEIKEISKQINKEGIYGYVITDELDKILQKCEVIKDEI